LSPKILKRCTICQRFHATFMVNDSQFGGKAYLCAECFQKRAAAGKQEQPAQSDPQAERRDPHASTPVVQAGATLGDAGGVLVLLHGRGSSPEDMLGLAKELDCQQIAYLAPQAAGGIWYPNRFLAPLESNEPWLSSALGKIDRLLGKLSEDGFSPSQVALLGFSQGACLALEYAARHARRFGAVIGLSGGLIGPPGTAWDFPGSLQGAPVFLGCSDVDPHIPLERVNESALALERLGGQVTKRIYSQMGHTVNQDEIDIARGMLQELIERR
jgi:phospholipase/carboxylesterase